jgi:hypothetical protein
MTTSNTKEIKQWILNIAAYLSRGEVPPAQYYAAFVQEPSLSSTLIDFINSLDEDEPDAKHSYYSAAVFAIDVYVSQLQISIEAGQRLAEKNLNQLMSNLATAISSCRHSLSFWLPVLNAFYEVHIELTPELKSAYLTLVDEEEPLSSDEEGEKLDSIRELIAELSDLSTFDIAENFFAQSYAMPPEFFSDLIIDLYSIDEGQDIALLALLHPSLEVRNQVVATFDMMMEQIELSSVSLSRLQIITSWYPAELQSKLNHWIKLQRKKGVVFHDVKRSPKIRVQASEVDGGGAQGVFIHINEKRKNRLCSLLFKQDVGIKDAWITPGIPAADVRRYYDESFDENITLRDVDLDYLSLFANHFLAITLEHNEMPDLHLLEIQEELGVHFSPQKMDVQATLNELAVLINPFTPECIQAAFARSKNWSKTKSFTESWYLENSEVDKLVNRCCSFVKGTKICRTQEAMDLVLSELMESQRDYWLFHFLWIALWAKAKSRKNEKTWQDSFFIAHAIQSGTPLQTIPIMHDICRQSVINSIETMQERRTHLTQEPTRGE